MDIVAPGVKIATTDLTGSAGYASGDYFMSFKGTSAATPMAAGVAALIISVNQCFMGSEVREILERTCQKVGNYSYNSIPGYPNGDWNYEMGYGIVNAHEAVQEAIARGARTCPDPIIWESCTTPPDESKIAVNSATTPKVEPVIVAFPNPFEQNIKFNYTLANNANVSLVITDALGRNVAMLLDDVQQKAGKYEIFCNSDKLPTGLYFYTLTVNDKTYTYKLIKAQ